MAFSLLLVESELWVKKNLSPTLSALNCLPIMQPNVAPMDDPTSTFSARPPVNKSMSLGESYSVESLCHASFCILLGVSSQEQALGMSHIWKT